MARQRERFERTDVPRNDPRRPYIAVGVIVVVAIVTFFVVRALWHKANQMNGLNDRALNDALYEQGYTEGPGEGAVESEDSFSNTLVFIVDDIHANPPTLQAAQILVRNTTNPAATIVNLPLNTRMLAGESNVMLSRYFNESGPTAALAPLTAAANIHVSHVIVASDRIWEQLEMLKGSTLTVLLGPLTDELETINSDYHTSELVSLGNALREIGFDKIAHLEAPHADEQFEDGTPVAVIDKQQICKDVGIFIQVEQPPAPEPEEQPSDELSEEVYYEGW